MRRKRTWLGSLLLVVMFLTVNEVFADTPLEAAQRGIEGLYEAVGGGASEAERVVRIEMALRGFVDFQEFAQRAVGDEKWRGFTSEDRAKVVKRLQDGIETQAKMFVHEVTKFRPDFEVRSVDGHEARVMLNFTRIDTGTTAARLELKLYFSEGGMKWMVYDAYIREWGVSILGNYQSQMRTLIRKGEFEQKFSLGPASQRIRK